METMISTVNPMPCFVLNINRRLFLIQVLPSLREKDGEFLLRGLVESWSNHKIMIKWMSRLFRYIDPYYIIRKSLPSLSEVGLICFRDLVIYHHIYAA